jgi:hypothetical protein
MIIARHYMIDVNGITPVVKSQWAADLENVLKALANDINIQTSNLIYLKDVNSGTLIKVEIFDSQLIVSYILDLFDFEREFYELDK